MIEFSLCEIECSCRLAKQQRREPQRLCLIERVSKQRISCVVFRKLLFKDEQIVVVVKDSVVVRCEQIWLDAATKLAIRVQVNLLDLRRFYTV